MDVDADQTRDACPACDVTRHPFGARQARSQEEGPRPQQGNAPVRWTVLEVHGGPDERVLRLLDERCGAELALHLRDGWAATPARPGDTLHVLAAIEVAQDGRAHATCDCASGACQWPELQGLALAAVLPFSGIQGSGHCRSSDDGTSLEQCCVKLSI